MKPAVPMQVRSVVRVFDDPTADASAARRTGLLWVDQLTSAFYKQPLSQGDGEVPVSAQGPTVGRGSALLGKWLPFLLAVLLWSLFVFWCSSFFLAFCILYWQG